MTRTDSRQNPVQNHGDTDEMELSARTGRLTLELIGEKADRDRLYFSTSTGRRLRPNTHVIIHNHYLTKRRIDIRTNSLGFRNPELGQGKKTRILFLGDSITLGAHLSEEETFVRLAEAISSSHGDDWETVNAGVKGISLEDELAILKETGISVEPDVVVLNFYLNDFAESPALYVPDLPALFRNSRLIQYICEHVSMGCRGFRLGRRIFSGPDYQRIAAWREEFEKSCPVDNGDYRISRAAFNKLILNDFIDWGGAWSEYAWDDLKPVFSEFEKLSDACQFRLAIVAFPVCYQVKAEYLYDYPQQQLCLIADRLDIPILDLLPILREEYQESGERLFYDQCHTTPYASKIIAERIVRFLRTAFCDWI